MELTTNEVIEAIHSLPSSEQAKIRRVLNSERRVKDEQIQKDLQEYYRAKEWVKEHRAEYLGRWVCLEGDTLIASGDDAREIHKIAKDRGIESPYIIQIIDEPENFTGAWL